MRWCFPGDDSKNKRDFDLELKTEFYSHDQNSNSHLKIELVDKTSSSLIAFSRYSSETIPLLGNKTSLEKKQDKLCYSIISEKKLMPHGLWQTGVTFAIFIGAIYFAGITAESFFYWAEKGSHLVPGVHKINSVVAPWGAVADNGVLNYVVLVKVYFLLLVQYWNEYFLKRQHKIKPKLGRDLALLFPTSINAVFAALPFGSLVLYKGDIKAFIEQMIVFSSMLGLGSFVIVMLAASLIYRIYSLVSWPCRDKVVKTAEPNAKFERNLKLVQMCPEIFLEAQVQEKNPTANLMKRIDNAAAKLEPYYGGLLDWQDSRWRRWLMVVFIGVLSVSCWMVSLIGYFYLTKSDGVNAILKIFGSPQVGSADRLVLGSVLFSPLLSFSIFYSIKDTVNTLMSYAEHIIYDQIQKCRTTEPKPAPEKNYWHNALYAVGAILTTMVFAGYFLAYEAAASSLALNDQKAGVHDPYTTILTCIGSMIFNGYGVFTLAVLLYWVAKLLFSYNTKERLEVFGLDQAVTFFRKHKGDLEVQPEEQSCMARLCVYV